MSKPWQSASRKADSHVTLGMTLFGCVPLKEAVALHGISTFSVQHKKSSQAKSGWALGTRSSAESDATQHKDSP